MVRTLQEVNWWKKLIKILTKPFWVGGLCLGRYCATYRCLVHKKCCLVQLWSGVTCIGSLIDMDTAATTYLGHRKTTSLASGSTLNELFWRRKVLVWYYSYNRLELATHVLGMRKKYASFLSISVHIYGLWRSEVEMTFVYFKNKTDTCIPISINLAIHKTWLI